MVATIANYLLSDAEFNLTMFCTLLHCKDGGRWGGHFPQIPHAGSAKRSHQKLSNNNNRGLT